MSNAAVELIEKRLESVNESVSRARTYLKVEETGLERARADFLKLEQEQGDLESALEELAQCQQEGLIRA
jgi:hypothetical protein